MAQARAVQYPVNYLFRMKRIDQYRDVRRAIKRQTALITLGKIGLVGEDGTRLLCALAAGQSRRQFDLKMHQQCAISGEQQPARFRVLDGRRPARGPNAL